MVPSPDLLTLLTWAEQLASGKSCAPWEAWCAAAPDAASKWERITKAQELLAGGLVAADDERALSADDLAAFVDGVLAPLDAQRIEQACWQSPEQLAELVSAVRFASEPVAAAVSPTLEARLLALAPKITPAHANGQPFKYRLAAVESVRQNGQPAKMPAPVSEVPETAAPATPVTLAPSAPPQTLATWHWPVLATVLIVAVVASGAVGWLAATWQHATTDRQPIARRPAAELVPVPLPPSDQPPPAPSIPAPSSPPEPAHSSESNEPAPAVLPKSDAPPAVPQRTSEPNATPPRSPSPPQGPPKHRPRVATAPPELAFNSPQGLMLVDAGLRGTWRVSGANYGLAEPVKVLSLAESWTTVEVPGVGTLVFAGDSEGSLMALPDGTIEVRLAHGRLGIENLRSGAGLRFVTGDAAWTARGISDHSTLALVCDPASSGLLVPRGALSIDDLEVQEGHIVRWQDGMPQTPQPLASTAAASSTAPTSLTALSPPAVNPWDLSWLQPPDETSRKEWRTTYGGLADRLRAADDAASELVKIAATTRNPRQAALAARWSLAANPSTASERLWNMLVDRRAAVRVAGVKSLLELPTADPRRVESLRQLHGKLGAATAKRVDEWLWTAWQPGSPPAAQASELVEHLQHGELAVRQIAVSLLELHTAAVFRQLERAPPVFDAAAPPSRRAAGYADWKAVMVQLYTPSRKGPTLLKQAQPAQRPLQQNAAPGVQ